ncbi:hypothetical protein R1sor_022402 [Riccia sorocarpa]|uniref:Uncharacterized protein n=1 Tax=Riccia sorocarpa TaxID=122646 RepID=A0ABD3GL91_9MARC
MYRLPSEESGKFTGGGGCSHLSELFGRSFCLTCGAGTGSHDKDSGTKEEDEGVEETLSQNICIFQDMFNNNDACFCGFNRAGDEDEDPGESSEGAAVAAEPGMLEDDEVAPVLDEKPVAKLEEETPAVKIEAKGPEDGNADDKEQEAQDPCTGDPDDEDNDDFPIVDLDHFAGTADIDLNQLQDNLRYAGYAVKRTLKLANYIPLARTTTEQSLQHIPHNEEAELVLPEVHAVEDDTPKHSEHEDEDDHWARKQ